MISATVPDIQHITGAITSKHCSHKRCAHSRQMITELRICPGDTVGFITGFQHDTRIIGETGRERREMMINMVDKRFGRQLTGQAAGICPAHTVTERKNRAGCFFTVFNQKAVLVLRSCSSLVCQPKAIHQISPTHASEICAEAGRRRHRYHSQGVAALKP